MVFFLFFVCFTYSLCLLYRFALLSFVCWGLRYVGCLAYLLVFIACMAFTLFWWWISSDDLFYFFSRSVLSALFVSFPYSLSFPFPLLALFFMY